MILVTGSGGLFGRALTRRLLDERRAYSAAEGDLRDRAVAITAVEACRPEVVVHLAGGRGKDRMDLYERNVLTTISIIEAAALSQRIPAVIVMGSAAEYGAGGNRPFSEDDPLRPLSDYGIAKAAQTTLAQAMGKRLEVPVTVLRPFNPVSPELGRETALGNAKAQLLEGSGPMRQLVMGRLDVVRDFVPIDVIVNAIVRVFDHPLPGEVVNVCSGSGIKLGDIVNAMARRLGVSAVTEVDEKLAHLPAPDTVIGDPTHMKTLLDLETNPTPETLAEVMLVR
jgi:GDP-4-dehydro-6-deoxy-D-mannose reductase